MKVRLGRVSALAALCAATVFSASAPVASATGTEMCSTISGAGSSLQNIAQNEVWIKGKEAFGGSESKRWEKSECSSDPTITYTATSSGKGLAQWGANSEEKFKEETGVSPFPAFIGTDVGPEGKAETAGTQLHEMDVAGKSSTTDNEVVTVPVAQSAIAIIVSLPESCTAVEKDTPKIKSQKLEEEWLKDEIQLGTLITGAGIVCTQVPHLYARESPSGTTAGFKRWNDDINPAEPWTKLTATAAEAESTNWPSSLPAGQPEKTGYSKGSQLAEGVFNTPGTTGAIGYADLADAVKAGFTTKVEVHGHKYASFMVEVQRNKSSEETALYASPEASGGSNCGTAEYKEAPAEVGPNIDWSKAKQEPVIGIAGYPICTLTFDVAWHKYLFPEKEVEKEGKKVKVPVYTAGECNSVLNYLKYVVGATEGGQNTQLTEHHYGKLPGAIQTKAENGVKKAGNIEC